MLAATAVLLLAGCGAQAKAPVSVTSQAGSHPVTHKPSPPLVGVLDPRVTQATINTTICRKTKPSWSAANHGESEYGIPKKRGYERDDIMPVGLGGLHTPANVRYVPLSVADPWDVIEARLHRQVCDGTLTLYAAQVKITEVKRGES